MKRKITTSHYLKYFCRRRSNAANFSTQHSAKAYALNKAKHQLCTYYSIVMLLANMPAGQSTHYLNFDSRFMSEGQFSHKQKSVKRQQHTKEIQDFA